MIHHVPGIDQSFTLTGSGSVLMCASAREILTGVPWLPFEKRAIISIWMGGCKHFLTDFYEKYIDDECELFFFLNLHFCQIISQVL